MLRAQTSAPAVILGDGAINPWRRADDRVARARIEINRVLKQHPHDDVSIAIRGGAPAVFLTHTAEVNGILSQQRRGDVQRHQPDHEFGESFHRGARAAEAKRKLGVTGLCARRQPCGKQSGQSRQISHTLTLRPRL